MDGTMDGTQVILWVAMVLGVYAVLAAADEWRERRAERNQIGKDAVKDADRRAAESLYRIVPHSQQQGHSALMLPDVQVRPVQSAAMRDPDVAHKLRIVAANDRLMRYSDHSGDDDDCA